MTDRLSFDDLATRINAEGFDAIVTDTGGGTAVIYAGKQREENGSSWFDLVAGPGSFDNAGKAWADEDVTYGRDDDDGPSTPLPMEFDRALATLLTFLRTTATPQPAA